MICVCVTLTMAPMCASGAAWYAVLAVQALSVREGLIPQCVCVCVCVCGWVCDPLQWHQFASLTCYPSNGHPLVLGRRDNHRCATPEPPPPTTQPQIRSP